MSMTLLFALPLLWFVVSVLLLRRFGVSSRCHWFAIALVPASLACMAVPIPIVALQAIERFGVLARAGHAGPGEAIDIAMALVNGLRFGAVCLVATACLTAVLGYFPGRTGSDLNRSSVTSNQARWAVWVGAGTLLLTVPVVLLSYRLFVVAKIIAAAGSTPAASAAGFVAATGLAPEEVASAISSGLAVSLFVAFPLIGLLLVASVASLFAARSASPIHPTRYSGIVPAVVAALGTCALAALTLWAFSVKGSGV